jgi:hypothetical protein
LRVAAYELALNGLGLLSPTVGFLDFGFSSMSSTYSESSSGLSSSSSDYSSTVLIYSLIFYRIFVLRLAEAPAVVL